MKTFQEILILIERSIMTGWLVSMYTQHIITGLRGGEVIIGKIYHQLQGLGINRKKICIIHTHFENVLKFSKISYKLFLKFFQNKGFL